MNLLEVNYMQELNQGTDEAGEATGESGDNDSEISAQIMIYVRAYLANPDRKYGEVTRELRLLGNLFARYTRVISVLAKEVHDDETRQRRVWLVEAATIPSGGCSALRWEFGPLIRNLGLPPRKRYSPVFTDEARSHPVNSQGIENLGYSLPPDLRDEDSPG